MSRRRFLRDAGAATLAASGALARPGFARTPRAGRPTVAVFGGGIAGLTAAHELAERRFDVTVYERRAWGGKARSTDVPGSAAGGRRPLPGEHGFRMFFGFYQNTVDTLRRIPFRRRGSRRAALRRLLRYASAKGWRGSVVMGCSFRECCHATSSV